MIRIGELARRTGVSQRLLRYYESRGLLTPRRLPSGYREYQECDVELVARIRRLLAAGLSTEVIAVILPCLRPDGARLVPTCPELVDRLRAERVRMDATIAELSASRDILDSVITAVP